MPIQPLDPADHVAHFAPPPPGDPMPSDAPQPYEWWYFELHFPGPAMDGDGEPLPGATFGVDDWVIVLSCHLPHFFDPVRLLDVTLGADGRGRGERIHPPFQYTGLALSIYRCTPTEPLVRTLVGFAATRCASATASMSRPFAARWGNPADPVLELEERVDSGRIRLILRDRGWWASRGLVEAKFRGRRARPLDIELELDFAERAPGFKVDDGVLMRDRWGGEHHWVLRMPDPRVTGRVTLRTGGRLLLDREVDTTGYHDHQWGPHLPLDVMKQWSWGRVLVAPDERAGQEDLLVFFRAEPLVEDPDPGVVPHGADIFTSVQAGGAAVQLQPFPDQEAVHLGGWDDSNYPLIGYDPAAASWTEGRDLPDVRRSVSLARPHSGPPFFAPPDDSLFSPLWCLAMWFGRRIARRRLRGGVGYFGAVSCAGKGPTGEGGAEQQHALVALQRGCVIEPWPFYNRYLPTTTVTRDGRRRDRIRFALSEFLEVDELMRLRPPREYRGRPIHEDLLGMALFSELMTRIEPGAPRLRHMWKHFG